jgi:hypothetical protein
VSEQGAFRLREASAYLGLAPHSQWLIQPDCPVPRCDLRRPGAKLPVWVWRKAALDAFLEGREVQPGQPNPQDCQ